MSPWLHLGQRITRLIAPPVCALCGASGQTLDELWGLDLCVHCESAAKPVAKACPRCGEPTEQGTQCAHCLHEPPPYDTTFCLFRYEEPADLLITRLKFRHELVHARVLGILFARALRAASWPLPQCLIPMPLHASRYRERGFNQTLEIARHLAPRLRHGTSPLTIERDLLQRVRATLPQSGLAAAARAANLASAFAVTRRRVPAHVALLDDVMTTGHTAAVAAQALREAGCKRVEIWACARALRRGDSTIC